MTNVVPLPRRVYGATADEWSHFELVVGAADLLPVVSRPGAQISEQSTLKGLGKTPSTFNGQGRVVGFPKWTQHRSTASQIALWSRNPDHGICVQTRRVRALDVDVPDVDLADRIEDCFVRALGLSPLPARTRAGTGKRLLAFELVGSFPKRSFKVEGGLVEFLGNGQQFIAIGEHFDGSGTPSGTRYRWEGDLPAVFPAVAQPDFELAWAAIVEEFALSGEAQGVAGSDRSRADLEGVDDPVAAYLDEHGLVLGAQGEKVFVACPWKAGHTADSGISETAWLVAGTKGFVHGHFQCMHASCSKRTDEDYLDEIGYRAAAFEVISDDDAAPGVGGTDEEYLKPWPKFKRDGKGVIEATLGNVILALPRPDIVGTVATPRYDAFRGVLTIAGQPIEDGDAVDMRVALERRGFKAVGREIMRDALASHARRHRYDSVQEWLQGLPPWDGVERVERFLPDHAQTADTEYTRAVGRYLWTALAGRVMQPGVKADMVPILQGEQGYRKSSLVEAICPDPENQFREIDLTKKDADLARALRGCVVGELAELRGLRTRDAESIKAWLVQRTERWVPKFFEYETSFARRCVLVATTNPPEVLDDETGERRWLPVEVLRGINVEAFLAVRDQFWAEGLARFGVLGIEWQDAERLAKPEHGKFKVRDSWTDVLQLWLDTDADVAGETWTARGWVQMHDLAAALGKASHGLTWTDERRLGKCMRQLGWKAGPRRDSGRVLWAWLAPSVSPE